MIDNLVPITVSIDAACKLVGLGRTKIYEAIARGDLHVRKSGRRTLIELVEVRRFIADLPSTSAGVRTSRSGCRAS